MKKLPKFDPLTLLLSFRRNPKGQLVIGYAGNDYRTPVIGELVIEILADALGAVPSE